jgi:hypothetical protein
MLNHDLLEQLSEFQIVINEHDNLEVTGCLNDEIRHKISANKPEIMRWVRTASYVKRVTLEWLDLIGETDPVKITHVVNVATSRPETLKFIERRIEQLKSSVDGYSGR